MWKCIKFPFPKVFLVSMLSQQEKTNQDKGLEDSSVQIASTGARNNFSTKSISKKSLFEISFPYLYIFLTNVFPY